MFKGGPEGLRSLTNPKVIIVDRWPSLIQTSIPKVLDYPLRSLSTSWYAVSGFPFLTISFDNYCVCFREFSSGLVRFFYGDNWRISLAGLFAAIRAARR